jgi:hypothetical protein
MRPGGLLWLLVPSGSQLSSSINFSRLTIAVDDNDEEKEKEEEDDENEDEGGVVGSAMKKNGAGGR